MTYKEEKKGQGRFKQKNNICKASELRRNISHLPLLMILSWLLRVERSVPTPSCILALCLERKIWEC